MRVEMLRLMCSPVHGNHQPGAVIDLPPAEARKRIASGDCRPADGPPSPPRRPAPADTAPGPDGDGPAVEKMTADQLKAFADAEGIDLGDATKKADVLAAVVAEMEHRRDSDDGTGGGGD
ncbi:hypothetical protein ABZ714_19505 [Streptomyces sp. NPDC006798]|uniref:hypothetical protein n=1 Tax=Streptomyces sp. NPDC006798 TaxID=3155462 RepID=UPI0033CE05AF